MAALTEQQIHRHLETVQFGETLIILPTIDSTNSYARREALPHGAVVLAEEQTAGKGRMGRSWFAEAGQNILMSVVLKPERPLHAIQIITLAAAVAVTDAFSNHLAVDGQVKWPNDVLIAGNKVCGILTEGQIRGPEFLTLVVGLGCNVNQQPENFPADLLYPATSLAAELGKRIDRNQLAANIITSLEQWYRKIMDGESQEVIARWKERCAHLNRRVKIVLDDGTKAGIFRKVSADGAAVLQLSGGDTVTVTSGDLFWPERGPEKK
ncbi:MAG TPA: biotin--[acetyl-CoA-carboxylase] ligase [bacterium]|nr:biotin--[acetyl-CoA-carboxylase] ligase [bacterium]